ncbi:MAG: hypothetical protein K2N48_01345 [Muribaculaceae bacterium]|nr:hypothetical protein [Muribaculaceae bacterium]
MTYRELEDRAKREITQPLQTTLYEAYAMGANTQECEYKELLEDIKNDLMNAVKSQDWEDVGSIIQDIERALKD